MRETSVLAAALELAEANIAVFPVVLVTDKETGKVDKIPAVAGWQAAATTDEAQLRAWFTTGDYAIGIPTGPRNRVDVLDIDLKHGPNQWWVENEARIPLTRRQQTQSSGIHIAFNHYPGMGCSVGRIAPDVDIRAGGGFIVHWPGQGFPVLDDTPWECLANWPPWLAEAAMRGRARQGGGDVPLDLRLPPGAQHVIDLLNRMPNPVEVGRDTYIEVMMAVKGCIDALEEAGSEGDDELIGDAAIAWAEKWPDSHSDERQKWEDDFSQRDKKLAGWQTLQKVARQLIPEYAAEIAKAEFAGQPPPEAEEYLGNPNWPAMLRLNASGNIATCLENARIALTRAPEWQGCLAYNAFANVILMQAQPPWAPWTMREWEPHNAGDVDAIRTTCWLHQQGIMVSPDIAGKAMQEVADKRLFHPVTTYLDRLAWDGVPRIDTWLKRHLGVVDRPLYCAYGAKFLISAVARVRSPGCQVDTVLILEGRQGLKKSTTLRILAGEWFVDHMPSLDNKDAQLQLQGVWIVEFAELGEFGRKDANLAKRFISTSKDKLRKPYGKLPEDFPRQCVLAMTLNPDAGGRYLKDETGVRRFWPVACGRGWPDTRVVDVAALTAERDQLWAEADHRFRRGEKWWLTDQELERQQAEDAGRRQELDIWHGVIAEFLEGKTEATAEEIYINCLGAITAKEWSHGMKIRVGRVLTMLAWASQRAGRGNEKRRVYEKGTVGSVGAV